MAGHPLFVVAKGCRVFVPKTFISPSTTAPKNELSCPSRAGSSMAEKLLDYLYATECSRQSRSKRTLQRLGSLQEDGVTRLFGKDLPGVTIQPFRVWH